MNPETFNKLNKKLKSIHTFMTEEKILDDRFWKGLSLLCTEMCNCFNKTEYSSKYERFFLQLFRYLTKLKENTSYNLKLISSVQIVVSEIINPKNDFPIWVLRIILYNALTLHHFENLLPNFFLLLSNDRCSARQKAILYIISKKINFKKIQEHVATSYTDKELANLLETALKEQNENGFRMFLNKFNHYTGNIISFSSVSMAVNKHTLIHNEWVDFSKKWQTISFSCPRKCLSLEHDTLESSEETNNCDIITIKVSSIGILKFKSDDKQNSAQLILQLNEPCTGMLQATSDFLSNCNIVTFTFTQELENFRNFLTVHFKITHTSTLKNFEYDFNHSKLIQPENISSNYKNLNDCLNVLQNSVEKDSIPSSDQRNGTYNSNVSNKEEHNINIQSAYIDSQNVPCTSEILVTSEIKNICISDPDSSTPNSDSTIGEICRNSSTNNVQKDISKHKKTISNDSLLKMRSSIELNFPAFLHMSSVDQGSKQNNQTEHTNQRVKKQRKMTTITESFVVATEEKNKILMEAANIAKTTQTDRSKSRYQLQEKCVNTDNIFIFSDYAENEYSQTITDENNKNHNREIIKPNRRVSSANKKSDSKTKKKKIVTDESNSNEYSDTSFFSSSYKIEDFEVRTHTRIIKKPEYFNSQSENKPKRKRRNTISCIGSNSLAESKINADDTESAIKRLKTLLPVQKSTESSSFSQKNLDTQNVEKENRNKKNLWDTENFNSQNKLNKKIINDILPLKNKPGRPKRNNLIKNTKIIPKPCKKKQNKSKITTSPTMNIIKNTHGRKLRNYTFSSRNSCQEYGIDNFIEDEIELALQSINKTFRVATTNRPKLIDKIIKFTQELINQYKN